MNLYTDGGVIGRNPSPLGGTWAWCLIENDTMITNASGVLTADENGMPVTNNVTELYALVCGLESLTSTAGLTVYSDSRVSLLRVFHAAALQNVPRWLTTRLHAIQRSGMLQGVPYVLLDGHPTKVQLAAGIGKRGGPCSRWNVWCDDACPRAARRYQTACREREVLA